MRGRGRVCSGRCRAEVSRRRRAAAAQARDDEIRAAAAQARDDEIRAALTSALRLLDSR